MAYPEAEVVATDQSADALALAKENVEVYVSDNRIRFYQGSWFDALPDEQLFDLIVSNPPYLTEAEMQTAEPEVISNEPHSALVSGVDGLDDLQLTQRVLQAISAMLACWRLRLGSPRPRHWMRSRLRRVTVANASRTSVDVIDFTLCPNREEGYLLCLFYRFCLNTSDWLRRCL